jgi:hypothetical protein
LTDVVGRIGNSLVAISKEATAQRTHLVPPPPISPASVIASVATNEPASSDSIITEQAP